MAALVLVMTNPDGEPYNRKSKDGYPLHITLGYTRDPESLKKVLLKMLSQAGDISSVAIKQVESVVWTAKEDKRGPKSIFLKSVESATEHQLKLVNLLSHITNEPGLGLKVNTREMHVEVDDVNIKEALPGIFGLRFAFSRNQQITDYITGTRKITFKCVVCNLTCKHYDPVLMKPFCDNNYCQLQYYKMNS